jgi:hypothetical protein
LLGNFIFRHIPKMQSPQQHIDTAIQLRTCRKVVDKLKARGYYVPQKYDFNKITPIEFKKQYMDKNAHEPFVLSSFSMVVSKISPTLLTDRLKQQTDNIILPNINLLINHVLEGKNEFDKWYKSVIEEVEKEKEVEGSDEVEEEEEEDEKSGSKEESSSLPPVSMLFDETSQRTQLLLHDISIPQFREDEILVMFVRKLNNATGIDGVTQVLKYRDAMQCKKLILILENLCDSERVISVKCVKVLKHLRYPNASNNFTSMEWFSMSQKKYNVSATKFHGRFELYSRERRDLWLAKHNKQLKQMETILLDDRMREFYDYQEDDFIQIHESDGDSRFVVIGVNK